MIKIVNSFFSILKFLLLIISFVLTFYIMMSMYQRLGKNYLDSIQVFIPFVILLVLMVLNYVLHQKHVTGNIFYNFTCCLVFGVFIFVAYRTMFDDYMLMRMKTNYNMSFHYFSDMVAPLKSMLYLLCTGNLCLMFSKPEEKKDPVVEKKTKVSTQ